MLYILITFLYIIILKDMYFSYLKAQLTTSILNNQLLSPLL
jgi:hypothetical protein